MSLRGITFTDTISGTSRHTGDDWDLVMSEKVIGTPKVKLKTVALNDRDGILDFTAALRGVPSYETRTLSFVFEYCGPLDGWTDLLTQIRNFLHGRRLKIIEPDDPFYFYMGRAEVGDPTGSVVKKFAVSVTADTWKYKATGETSISGTVAAGQTLTLLNDWRPVVPSITATETCEFIFLGTTYSISGTGTFRFPKLVLTHGSNLITFESGTGTITFRYQEGAL